MNQISTTVGFLQWSGFRTKTLWDVLELLIVPSVLAVGGYLFSQTERKRDQNIAKQRTKTDREIATDRAQENLLQNYLDRMTELLLEKGLRSSEDGSEVRAVARARTLTVLRGLDGDRKGQLLRFLTESYLVEKDKVVIDLRGADLSNAKLFNAQLLNANLNETHLSGADLRYADLASAKLRGAALREAELSGANLRDADLSWAFLNRANLTATDLSGADLSRANLMMANLKRADLTNATVTDEQLSEAYSLELTTMRDGTKHQEAGTGSSGQ